MNRTRIAVIEGAGRAVEKYGSRRATMGDIATLAGIAKATIYNHFRTKEDIYRAAVEAGVRELAGECAAIAASDLAEALARAAGRLAAEPALRRIAAEEPAVLAEVAIPGDGPAWDTARQATGEVLKSAGVPVTAGSVDLVLRWLAGHVGAPGTEESRATGAAVIVAGFRDLAANGGRPAKSQDDEVLF